MEWSDACRWTGSGVELVDAALTSDVMADVKSSLRGWYSGVLLAIVVCVWVCLGCVKVGSVGFLLIGLMV